MCQAPQGRVTADVGVIEFVNRLAASGVHLFQPIRSNITSASRSPSAMLTDRTRVENRAQRRRAKWVCRRGWTLLLLVNLVATDDTAATNHVADVLGTIEATILERTNVERAKAGVAALESNDALATAAGDFAQFL